MNQQEIQLVCQSWQQAAEEPLRLAILFFDRLFEEAPELRQVFRTPMSEKTRQLLVFFGFHINRLASGSIRRPSFEAYVWEELLTDAQKGFLMETLSDTVAALLKPDWTPALQGAWGSFRKSCQPYYIAVH
ncbi:hypothetical protein [Flavihumibacter petaseus]|nr:hypothetical protein [Flavihumibacter petaseus]